jgi:hypothetical protein
MSPWSAAIAKHDTLIVGCSVLQEALRERVRSGERTCLMVRNTPSLEPLYIKTIFHQDRLGTNIGKVEKRVAFFAGRTSHVNTATM